MGATARKVSCVAFAESLSKCSLVTGKSGLKKAPNPNEKIIIIYNLSAPRSSEPSRPYCVSGSSHQPPLLLLPSRSVSCAAIPATGAEPAPAEVSCHLLIAVPAARPAHAAAPAPASDPAALGPAPAAALRVSFPGPQLPRAAYTDRPHFIATCFICTLQRLRFFVCLFFVFLFFVFFVFFTNCRFVASTSKKITTPQRRTRRLASFSQTK